MEQKMETQMEQKMENQMETRIEPPSARLEDLSAHPRGSEP